MRGDGTTSTGKPSGGAGGSQGSGGSGQEEPAPGALLDQPVELVPLGQALFPTRIAQAFALPSLGSCGRVGPPLDDGSASEPRAGLHAAGGISATRGPDSAPQFAVTTASGQWTPAYGSMLAGRPSAQMTTSQGVAASGSAQQHTAGYASTTYPVYMPAYPGGAPAYTPAVPAPGGALGGGPYTQFGMTVPIPDQSLYSSLSYSGGAPSSSGMAQYMRVVGQSMTETTDEDCGDGARAVKRARLVWTPQLHKRFEEAVAKLGPEKSIPKNIMQEMNVEGLTRENVASHLQKYRLQKKVSSTTTTTCKDETTNASDPPAAT